MALGSSAEDRVWTSRRTLEHGLVCSRRLERPPRFFAARLHHGMRFAHEEVSLFGIVSTHAELPGFGVRGRGIVHCRVPIEEPSLHCHRIALVGIVALADRYYWRRASSIVESCACLCHCMHDRRMSSCQSKHSACLGAHQNEIANRHRENRFSLLHMYLWSISLMRCCVVVSNHV